MKLTYSVAVFLAVAGPGLLGAEEWNKKYTLNGKPELRVDTNDAAVDIRGGDLNWIEARVVTTGWKIRSGEVSVVEHQTGNIVDIAVRVPREYFTIGNRSVQIYLTVPRQLAAVIRTSDGHIAATSLGGDLRLNSGDGRIDAQQIDGILDAETGDGRMEVSGRFDRLNLRTNDGHMVVKIAAGSKISSPWRIQTGDGSVEIGLADNLNLDLDAHTGDGHITVDLPVTASHQQGENTFRGKINAGGPQLLVRTGDGSIHVRRSIM
jgi:hypothetical protein